MPSVTVLEHSLGLACRAPSLHNSQPWRWIVDATGDAAEVQLFADHRRIGRSTDRSGRELVISCGAALDHLRVAMAAAGWATSVDRFPNPNDPDHLATARFTELPTVTPAHSERAAAIGVRRTDRLPFGPPTDWSTVETVLRQNVFDDTVMLTVLADDARAQLAEASRLSESLRRYDASYHAELQWWTTPTWVSQGLPPDALPSERERERVDVGRVFPARGSSDRRPDVAEDRSTIVVLATPEDSMQDALRCGEALSALLLECTLAGLATCPLTHMIEVEPSRDIVRSLLDRPGLPQALVRVGSTSGTDAPPETPRRPLAEVLEIRGR
ncbi:Acg family FMN-binding oxidoreductase [Mycolicibacterium thermoresistibile]